jgi:predicted nucleotidyltransferase
LRTRGVRHAGPQSDIDIMIDIDHTTVRDVYTYVGLASYIADLFPDDKVDVINRNALKSFVRAPAEADAVYVF